MSHQSIIKLQETSICATLCIMFGSIAFVLEMQSNSPSSPMLMLAEVELSLDDPQVISEHC